MNGSECQTAGLYQQGDSLLHRLDPRLKLVLLLLLIICLFAAPGPYRLLVLLVIGVGGLLLYHIPYLQILKKLMILRWLLLFSLVLHLFFTPGRTLLGTSWLSYDGLLRGLTVDLQLALSLVFSYLLALTTSPESLAWGLTRLLSPLASFGVPVRESGGLLLLVLHFIPLVREEMILLYQQKQVSKFPDRVRSVAGLIGPLLLRLVDRADSLAHEIVTEGLPLGDESLGQDGSLSWVDWWMLASCCPVLLLLWIL